MAAKKTEEVKVTVAEEEAKVEETKADSKGPKRVRIRVPRVPGKGDITVGVNGKVFKVQRGKTVEVPEYVAEVIEQSLEQDYNTEDMIERIATD